jgi:hypothetical protein
MTVQIVQVSVSVIQRMNTVDDDWEVENCRKFFRAFGAEKLARSTRLMLMLHWPIFSGFLLVHVML